MRSFNSEQSAVNLYSLHNCSSLSTAHSNLAVRKRENNRVGCDVTQCQDMLKYITYIAYEHFISIRMKYKFKIMSYLFFNI